MTREPLTISITRTLQGWECAAIVGNVRRHMHYIGYTKRQALREFRAWLKVMP